MEVPPHYMETCHNPRCENQAGRWARNGLVFCSPLCQESYTLWVYERREREGAALIEALEDYAKEHPVAPRNLLLQVQHLADEGVQCCERYLKEMKRENERRGEGKAGRPNPCPTPFRSPGREQNQ